MQNSRTLMSVVGAAIVIGVIALGYWAMNRSASFDQPSELKNWQMYSLNNFSLQYPDLYKYSAGDNHDYPVGSSLVIPQGQQGAVPTAASFVIDESQFEGTNLAGAWVTVANSPSTEAECQTANNGNEIVPLDRPAEINDVTWHEYPNGWIAEAAAGTKFETRLYHAYNNDLCYEVGLHLATTNIGNYEPGAVTAVDEGALRAQLQSIFHTSQFAGQ